LIVRTNIEIDSKLLSQAMRVTGVATKKAAVEAALEQAVRLKRQERIRQWMGKIEWEGDLQAMRASRFPEWDNGVDTISLPGKTKVSTTND
jgi:Arc/MetJ family transcription regulator